MSDIELESDEGFTGSFDEPTEDLSTETKEVAKTEPEPETEPEAAKDVDQEVDPEADQETKTERKPPSKRIHELTAKYREEQRKAQELEARIAQLEASRVAAPQTSAEAPNPEAYEYGAIDERYLNDLVQFRTQEALKSYIETAKQEQQQQTQQQAELKQIEEIRSKAESLLEKGSNIHEDYDAVVLEAGMRGEWALEQPTFEAASEAEYGAEILYALANNPSEANKVASLTPIQQARYVFQKDSELAARKNVRTTKAPTPPGNPVKGASGRFEVSPDTDDLDAFEKVFFK